MTEELTKKQKKLIEKEKKLQKEKLESRKKLYYKVFIGLMIIVAFLIVALIVNSRQLSVEEVKDDVDPIKGADNALIEIREYSDFTCPACRGSQAPLSEMMEKYSGQVKLIFNTLADLSLESSQKTSIAAECAFEQAKFWQFHDLLFENQDEWLDNVMIDRLIEQYAEQSELNLDQFNQCLNSNKAKNQVNRDNRESQILQVHSTPTFFVNDRRVVGLKKIGEWDKIIAEELEKLKSVSIEPETLESSQ